MKVFFFEFYSVLFCEKVYDKNKKYKSIKKIDKIVLLIRKYLIS